MISSKSVSRVPSGLDCTISPTHRQRVAGKPVSGGGSMASAGVCLGSHPLHGNLPPGDTLVRNPHRSSKIGRTRNSSDLERFVIKPALREANTFSSYHVQLERVRVGKRVERV